MPILGSSNSAANKDMMSKIMNKWGYNNLIQLETLWEKEKLLVKSNFSFSHNVFKSCFLLMRRIEYLWSKGLKTLGVEQFKSLPDDKFLALSKLKAFADDKFKYYPDIEFVCHSVENILRKGGNAGYQHFSLFHNVFKHCFPQGIHCVVKSLENSNGDFYVCNL